ncbi:DEAD/DEAH box helicase [Methanocalculus taiwanensis]|nr:DEAD/DEAH box helicase [Methanocalculus taiwanensis]
MPEKDTSFTTGAYSRLHPALREILASRLRWDDLWSVQEEALSVGSAGSDLIIIAPTAGGKTESGFLPALDSLLKTGASGVGVLYISPLKALINDQINRITRMTAPLGLEVRAWHGDIVRSDRIWKEGEAPHILLTTPESLEILLGDAEYRSALINLRSVIVDEVHAFMGSDRGVQLACLLDRLDILSGRKIQRIGLSATIGNPEELLEWFSDKQRRQHLVAIPPPRVGRRFSFILDSVEYKRILSLARVVVGKKALVFTGSRSEAEKLHSGLSLRNKSAYVHHSAVSSDLRTRAEEEMAGDSPACIICTSTLELGIDIGGLDLVVQYGAPDSVSSFLQRLGRSGRRGRPPEMVFILSSGEEALLAAAAIESARNREAEPLLPLRFPCHVFVQQLFVLLRQRRMLGRSSLLRALLHLSPFAGISTVDADLILDHLLDSGYLAMDGDLLVIGMTAEAELSRSHWISLCSVISAGGGYRAVTPDGEAVGTLDSLFVEIAAEEGFTLAGRGWRVISRDDARRGLLVVQSDRHGPRPFWTGGGRAGVSPLLAHAVGRIAARRGSDLSLPEEMHEVINDEIHSWPYGISPEKICVISEPLPEGELVSLWTFLGERQNATLAHLMRHLLPPRWPVRSTYAAVTVEVPRGDFGEAEVREALIQLIRTTEEELIQQLPPLPPETWAFGRLLPDEIRQRMAAVDIYSLPEVVAAVRERYSRL